MNTDHNLYIKGNRMYQANYNAGLRILDISDPTNPREVGYLDTAPGEDNPNMDGAWSNYPYFKSGTIIVTSTGQGLFLGTFPALIPSTHPLASVNGVSALKCTALISKSARAVRRAISSAGGKAEGIMAGLFLTRPSMWSKYPPRSVRHRPKGPQAGRRAGIFSPR